jgi:multidrug efflux pump subunit AcrA (membrane-fusion protein)
LPANEYTRLSKLSDANFVIDNKTFKLKELNGKISGTTVSSGSSGFVSVYFQIENNLNLMPNSYVTAYLFGSIISNSVTVPKEALWEDQGNYYVFVQKHGELFEKREVTIAGFDGINYLIGSGLSIGDVLVSKGAYRVMLASKTSELPAQSHAH